MKVRGKNRNENCQLRKIACLQLVQSKKHCWSLTAAPMMMTFSLSLVAEATNRRATAAADRAPGIVDTHGNRARVATEEEIAGAVASRDTVASMIVGWNSLGVKTFVGVVIYECSLKPNRFA
jgi:hypothetical protein